MANNETKSCSLKEARQLILRNLHRLPGVSVALHEARNRIAFTGVEAAIPQPSFDESTRDGYVLPHTVFSGETETSYRIEGEIPAGKSTVKSLATGTACRIMTGGCVPEGGTRVVPYEECREVDGKILIPAHLLRARDTFIKETGSEIDQGELLVPAGEAIQTGHLALFATCGLHSVSVATRPLAGYVCTGSELASSSEELVVGQKVSSNAFLMEGFLASAFACPVDMGIIKDSRQDLLDLLAKVQRQALDVMITTGGMGPGKYDLVESAFVEAGGAVVFNSLQMRPGKSVLFGILGRTLFFGLPGPPHAVWALLNELVGPALLAMQGAGDCRPKMIKAHLLHPIKVKRNDVLRLKEAVLLINDGKCSVRSAARLEMPNCLILLPPGQEDYRLGELVEVHLGRDLLPGL